MWGKTMDSVFWNSEGISLVGFLERGATISSAERYVQTLKKLKNELEGFGQTIWIKSTFCMTTPVHTSLHTRVAITAVVWTAVPHPPYSPDLALSYAHLIGSLNDAFRRQRA